MEPGYPGLAKRHLIVNRLFEATQEAEHKLQGVVQNGGSWQEVQADFATGPPR
jgi:hypothetical protein